MFYINPDGEKGIKIVQVFNIINFIILDIF